MYIYMCVCVCVCVCVIFVVRSNLGKKNVIKIVKMMLKVNFIICYKLKVIISN